MRVSRHNYSRKIILPVVLLSLLLWATENSASNHENERPGQYSDDQMTTECGVVVDLLEKQKTKLSRELRSIKREISMLKLAIEKPGIQEIFAGVGYILGLFGMAALMLSRSNSRTRKQKRE